MLRATALILLALVVMSASLFLLPADSDGAFAAYDGVVYATAAQRGEAKPASFYHPLFHAIVSWLTPILRERGVAAPGHVAIRIVSGAGAAAACLLIACASGRRRWVAGIGFAAALLATQAFLVDAAVGETVPPACAAGIWAMLEVARSPVKPWRVFLALTLAVLLRADSILLVPGLVAGLLAHRDRGLRPGRIAIGLSVAGAVTLLGYALFWWTETRGRVPLWEWANIYASNVKNWISPRGIDAHQLLVHVDSSSAAVVGKSWPVEELNLWIGPAVVSGLVLAGLLLRGRSRVGPLVFAIAVTILARGLFFSWFDARNPEWSILTIALAALLGARLAEGEARWAVPVRALGAAALLAIIVASSWAHGPFTARLRRRGFVQAMTHAVNEGAGCRVVALGPNVHNALEFLEVPHALLPVAPGSEDALPAVMAELAAHPEPTLIVFERWTPWMVAAVPHMMAHAPTHRLPLDALAPTPALRAIQWEGYTYAVRYFPADGAPK